MSMSNLFRSLAMWDHESVGGHTSMPVDLGASERSQTKRDLNSLSDQVERLTLVCWAMWTLIQEETRLTEQDLLARVKALDAADGRADGKATRQLTKCGQCGRTMAPRHEKCIWCGHARPISGAFDTLT